MQQQLDVFIESFTYNRKGIIVVAAIAFVLASYGVYGLLLGHDTVSGGALAGLFTAIGVLLLSYAFRNPEKQPIVVTLRERADDVVRLTEQRLLVNGVHSMTTFTLRLRDGSEFKTSVKPKYDNAARQALEELCHNARFDRDPAEGSGREQIPKSAT